MRLNLPFGLGMVNDLGVTERNEWEEFTDNLMRAICLEPEMKPCRGVASNPKRVSKKYLLARVKHQ